MSTPKETTPKIYFKLLLVNAVTGARLSTIGRYTTLIDAFREKRRMITGLHRNHRIFIEEITCE